MQTSFENSQRPQGQRIMRRWISRMVAPMRISRKRRGRPQAPLAWRGSGRFARTARAMQVAVARRAQFFGVEVVDRDRVERHHAQLFQLRALLGGDPAFANALVKLAGE